MGWICGLDLLHCLKYFNVFYYVDIINIKTNLNISLYVTLITSAWLRVKTNIFYLEVKVTYNCPCEEHWVVKSIPATLEVWPCPLLIVIPNANFIGNWSRLNWKGNSQGIMGIHYIKTVSPVLLPVKMVHSIKKFFKVTTLSLVAFHSFDGF